MNAVLLDTDVYSFFFKNDTRSRLYAGALEGKRICLSFMSVAQLLRWTKARNWGESRRNSLVASLQQCLLLPYERQWPSMGVDRRDASTCRPVDFLWRLLDRRGGPSPRPHARDS